MIAFNARYLMDCLAACDGKEIRVGFQDELSPAQVVRTWITFALASVATTSVRTKALEASTMERWLPLMDFFLLASFSRQNRWIAPSSS